LSQLGHFLLGAGNAFLEFANALDGSGPDVIVSRGLLARCSAAAGGVSAGAGEHLLDRHL
jgi:hypothetical protein